MAEDRHEGHVQPVDLGLAVMRGLITTKLMHELLKRTRERLQAAGYGDLQLSATHVLLSIRHNREHDPRCRRCSFYPPLQFRADAEGFGMSKHSRQAEKELVCAICKSWRRKSLNLGASLAQG